MPAAATRRDAWIHAQPDVCKICPFSRTCNPGQYSGKEYDRIAAYDGTISDQLRNEATVIYYCHMTRGLPGQSPLICAGWIACFDSSQLVALNRSAEEVDWGQVLSFHTSVPVFSSGTEAAEHGRGKVPAGFSALRQQLAKKKSRLAVDVDALTEEIMDAVIQWSGGDPKRLDRAAKVLSYNPHLGELPARDSVHRYRPRWCTACDDCPQYRAKPAGAGVVGSVCKCGCPASKHSYSPRQINRVKKGEARDEAAH